MKALTPFLLALPLLGCSIDQNYLDCLIGNITSKPLKVNGLFYKYDFNKDGHLASSDWIYIGLQSGKAYQLLGNPPKQNDVFGWKVLNTWPQDLDPDNPSGIFIRLNFPQEYDNRFSWIYIPLTDRFYVFKLMGANADGSLKYFDIDCDGKPDPLPDVGFEDFYGGTEVPLPGTESADSFFLKMKYTGSYALQCNGQIGSSSSQSSSSSSAGSLPFPNGGDSSSSGGGVASSSSGGGGCISLAGSAEPWFNGWCIKESLQSIGGSNESIGWKCPPRDIGDALIPPTGGGVIQGCALYLHAEPSHPIVLESDLPALGRGILKVIFAINRNSSMKIEIKENGQDILSEGGGNSVEVDGRNWHYLKIGSANDPLVTPTHLELRFSTDDPRYGYLFIDSIEWEPLQSAVLNQAPMYSELVQWNNMPNPEWCPIDFSIEKFDAQYIDDASIRRYILYRGDKKIECIYHRNGKVEAETIYRSKNGDYVLDGIEKWWKDDGTLEVLTTYKDGMIDGYHLNIDNTGRVTSIFPYKNGKKEGREYQFDQNGNVISCSLYEDNIYQSKCN